jgi:hypothetical protein
VAEVTREPGAIAAELAPRRFARGSDAGVEAHVAELRAVRDRLAQELAVLEQRVDELATVRPPLSDDERTERAAELAAKLRDTRAELDASRWMRTAITDHLVAREHEVLASVGRDDDRVRGSRRARWRMRLPIALAGVLVGGALGGVAVATLGDDDPARAPAPAANPRPVAAEPRPVPSCKNLPPDAADNGTITCTTGTTLGITSGREPLLLDGIQVRVLRSVRVGPNVDVRLRVRNLTDQEQDLTNRLYLAFKGNRIPPLAPPGIVGPQDVATLSLSFATGFTNATRADLGVVPFDEPADPGQARRLGAVRLVLE